LCNVKLVGPMLRHELHSGCYFELGLMKVSAGLKKCFESVRCYCFRKIIT